jgi:predicted ester cyclase
LITTLYFPNCTYHDSSAPFELPSGPDGIKQLITILRTAFGDMVLSIESIILEEDLVVVCWEMEGSNTGYLLTTPTTGRNVTVTGISQLRFNHGQVEEEWTNWDALGMLDQLGLVKISFR